jgi:PDZ domain-containing protein
MKIHGVATNTHHDKIMLADVFEEQLSAWQWITMHFESHVQFVTSSELVEPGIPTAELDAQGFLEMSDAKKLAEAAAFRSLGWTIPATRTGTVVTGVVTPSPAAAAKMHVGDLVTGVNGTKIASSCQLISYVHDLAPGTVLSLNVDRVHISNNGTLSYASPSKLSVVTGAAPSDTGSAGCPGVTGSDKSFLGVSLEDGFSYKLPATVSINTADIGGPSAGLAMTLTLIDELSSGSLTGHHAIAATGTMDANGNVGAIGGVGEKAVAVKRAGASYFIVPKANVQEARAEGVAGLKILGVSTLKGALRDLRKLGGVQPKAITKPF